MHRAARLAPEQLNVVHLIRHLSALNRGGIQAHSVQQAAEATASLAVALVVAILHLRVAAAARALTQAAEAALPLEEAAVTIKHA